MSDDLARQCAQLIKNAKSIVALTGAGISTSAGIPDFRGPQGLYVTRQYDPETVFDIDYFLQDPKPFFDFARDFVQLEEKIKPTLTHYFLAKLEQLDTFKGVITQNIDALHHKAGSHKVYEIHGTIWSSTCMNCSRKYSYDEMKTKIKKESIALCTCTGVIKPDIVFFGENVHHLQESADLAEQADLFFVIGSSCVVYPAAMIPKCCYGKIVIVNKGEVALRLNNIALNVQEDTDQFFAQVQKYLF